MQNDPDQNLEQAFSLFLERREYDEANAAIFDLVRAAFIAGYRAALGCDPLPQPPEK